MVVIYLMEVNGKIYFKLLNALKRYTCWKNENELGLTDNYIQNGTDLNNISEPGKYEINNNTVYNSLLNAPTTNEGVQYF